MALSTGELTENQARQVCGWRYSGDYAIYNCPPWDDMLAQNWALTDKNKRKNEFKSVHLNDVFIGFFRLQLRENKLYLGLGLSPEYCGKGYGYELIEMIKEYTKRRFPQNDLYLEVRDFNNRAIRCYLKSGFDIENENIKNGVKFIVMRCSLFGV